MKVANHGPRGTLRIIHYGPSRNRYGSNKASACDAGWNYRIIYLKGYSSNTPSACDAYKYRNNIIDWVANVSRATNTRWDYCGVDCNRNRANTAGSLNPRRGYNTNGGCRYCAYGSRALYPGGCDKGINCDSNGAYGSRALYPRGRENLVMLS